MHKRRPTNLVMLALLSVTSAGCLDWGVKGTHLDAMRYNSSDDSFEFLHSWTNIRCKNHKDLNHLKSICKRSNSIVVCPVGILTDPAIGIPTVPAIERL